MPVPPLARRVDWVSPSSERVTVNRFSTSLLLLAALTASAAADPEVRDHTAPNPTAERPAIEQRPHYRRRPGPRLMMPLKLDIGMAGASTSRGFAPGIGGAIGIHWASLS